MNQERPLDCIYVPSYCTMNVKMTIWRLPENFYMIAWQLPDNCSMNAKQQLDGYLTTARQLFNDYPMTTIWLPSNSVYDSETKPRQLPEKRCYNNKNYMLMRLPDAVHSLKIKLQLLKYEFCKKSLRKNETLTSWTLLAHFFSRSVLIQWAKSVQLVRVSFFLSDFLQNPYFSKSFKNIH